MQLSIGKLATILIALLVAVTIVTTGTGLYVLQHDYRSLEERHEAEAKDAVRNAAIAVRNQVRFYQGMLQLISTNSEVINLLEFADTGDISRWSQALGQILPHTLGVALAATDGTVLGDPLALRIGADCASDMRRFAGGDPVDYPLLHTDVAGLEHFDLISPITTPSGGKAGTLFVSFRLSVVEELLRSVLRPGDQIRLLDRDGSQRLVAGAAEPPAEARTYRTPVPDTPWQLVLYRATAGGGASLGTLIVTDALIVLVVSLLVVSLVRGTLARFRVDMARIHSALSDVLEGRYQPSSSPTAMKETGMLLPDIERLALRIQQQRDSLRQQSLSDPLTGAFNRRYFDLMLSHLHEQSRRQPPATLAVIDLNDFKHINDEFGHQTGDRVLKNAAHYLGSRVRATDIVARLGGDEFAIVLTHMSRETLHDWLTALIHDHDHRMLEADAGAVELCQFSIGVASIDAAVYATPDEVFDAADNAMYRVKQRRDIRHSRYAMARSDEKPALRSVPAGP